MTQLSEQYCKPCEGGVDPLPPDRVSHYLEQVPGWSIGDDGLSENDFICASRINALLEP